MCVLVRVAALFVGLALLGSAGPAGAPAQGNVPHYDMTVDLRPDDGRIRVEGRMRLRVGPASASEVVISVNRAFVDVALAVDGEQAEIAPRGGFTDYAIRPATPFTAGRDVVIRFSYGFDPSTPVSYFYAGQDGAFASGVNVAWYPQVAGASPAGIGNVRFLLDEGASVVVNGALPIRRRLRTGRDVRVDFTAPTAFSFAAGRMHSYGRGRSARVLLLSPRAYGADYERKVDRILSYYDHLFGAYPFQSFALVEIPEEGARASGFTGQAESGMIWVTPRYLGRSFNFAYYGHEVGHQWWGHLVTKDFETDSGFYMVDEGLAQWGALQLVEAFEGSAAAARFRRSGYPNYSSLQNGLGYLTLIEAGGDEIIDAPRAERSHLIANSKGFLTLDLLAETMGRDRFRAALRAFLREHAHGEASWRDLKAALLAAAGEDLSWFAEQWFARAGAPDWTLTWRPANGGVEGEIAQNAPFYRARLEVAASGSCGRRAMWIDVSGPSTPFAIDLPCSADNVELDPNYRVLRWTPEFRARAPAHVPFARWALGDHPTAQQEIAALLTHVRAPDDAGVMFQLHADSARIHQYDGGAAEALAAWRRAVTAPNPPPDELPLAYLAMARAARDSGDLEAMRTALAAAIEAERDASAPTGAAVLAEDVEAGR